jgi:hypothetical protein
MSNRNVERFVEKVWREAEVGRKSSTRCLKVRGLMGAYSHRAAVDALMGRRLRLASPRRGKFQFINYIAVLYVQF